jgi:alpha-L-rhamnosidase
MKWRKSTSVDDLGINHGHGWSDWLAQGRKPPRDYIDTVFWAISATLMADMADAIGKTDEAKAYRDQFKRTKLAFNQKYVSAGGSIPINTQSGYILALQAKLIPDEKRDAVGQHLVDMIAANRNRMTTGFLGTRSLLPALSSTGHNDLAAFLLQSRVLPSWGYGIDQGATTIWERWDSYTKDDAFGRYNASMNSFSHYAFGSVGEWMFRSLAGIDAAAPGYKMIVIKPMPPQPGSNAEHEPIDWVKAAYQSIHGLIRSEWKIEQTDFHMKVEIPANTTAMVYVPYSDTVLKDGTVATPLRTEKGYAVFEVGSGTYQFVGKSCITPAAVALHTAPPADPSINPGHIELSQLQQLATWDFNSESDMAQWQVWHNITAEIQNGKTMLTGTGSKAHISTTLPTPLTAPLAIAIKARPIHGTTLDLYYAQKESEFHDQLRVIRKLLPSDALNTYVLKISAPLSIHQLRIVLPSNTAGFEIESITLYAL